MPKPMKRRDVEAILVRMGCKLLRNTGDHEKWGCPCGQHTAPVPRHKEVSAGVVKSISKMMACLEEGWLQ